MKKITKTIACVFLSVFLCVPVFAHDSQTPYNWYCKNNDEHEPPKADGCFDFMKNHNCVYIDADAGNEKVIYLTFDAGYENGNVEKILDTLKNHNAVGAFFILENLMIRNPETVKRMSDEGHVVCNHTAKHHDMTKITDKGQFEKELSSLEKQYFDLTGREMAKFYRPPEGRFSEENLTFADELGYKTVFWSFAYADWDNDKQPDENAAYEKIISHTHNGEIILLHPTSATNAAILDRVMTEWENEGYRFGSLCDL